MLGDNKICICITLHIRYLLYFTDLETELATPPSKNVFFSETDFRIIL